VNNQDEGWHKVEFHVSGVSGKKSRPEKQHITKGFSGNHLSYCPGFTDNEGLESVRLCFSRRREEERQRKTGPDSSTHLGWKGCGRGQSRSLVTCEVREHWSQIKANHPEPDWIPHSDCQHPTGGFSRTNWYSKSFLRKPNCRHHHIRECMS